jgi:hypothetical protein
MPSWASLADYIFKREERCEKLIKYEGRSFEFKGISIEIPGLKLMFEGFSTEPRVLEKANEAAKALDDLQYQLCQDLSKNTDYCYILAMLVKRYCSICYYSYSHCTPLYYKSKNNQMHQSCFFFLV